MPHDLTDDENLAGPSGAARTGGCRLSYPVSVVLRGDDPLYDTEGPSRPFYLFAATYGCFYWLDRNASPQATRAISAWLKGHLYRRIDVRDAIVAAFDRIYSSPLWRSKAFCRSAILSFAICMAYIFFLYPRFTGRHVHMQRDSLFALIIVFVTVIMYDYISLFFVRRYLSVTGRGLIGSLLLSLTIASIVIAISVSVGSALLFANFLGNGILTYLFALTIDLYAEFQTGRGIIEFMYPALLVHLWLPLLAFGALGVRLFYPIFRAVEWAQWFLKEGDRHPLRAIGVVAAALVFAVTAV